MPIREYKCGQCGFQFESIDLRAEPRPKSDKTECPNCGSKKVGKKISVFSSLKGGVSSSDTKPAPRGLG